MRKVLLIDDEPRMLDLLALYLKPHHYHCTKAAGADAALEHLKSKEFDIVLLDVMMPYVDGWQLCAEIRKQSDVPIIMVTAREQQEDVVKGLKIGADDYVVKPFNEEELLARMEALLRRRTPRHVVEVAGMRWHEEHFELTYNGEIIRLTPKEFAMIGLFMKNSNKVYEREQLIELIWGHDSETEGRTVDSHVRNMREKIRQAGFPIDEYLKTVWGIGYKWVK